MVASNQAQAGPSTDARVERYRQAERAFWDSYRLTPAERFVTVGSPPVRLRVQELGSGDPVLFVNGTGGPGAYFAPLLPALHGFRCLVLDRPGWGLSTPVDYSRAAYRTVVAELLAETLDALGIDRTHLVGGSIGSLWALRLAQAHPARVDRLVLLGGGPLTAETPVPRFIRLLRSPLGRLIIRVPEKPAMVAKQLAGLGHATGGEPGQVPAAFVDWRLAQSRETDWRRHERDMVRCVLGREGFVPGFLLTDAELAGITQPTLMVYGTADPVGSVDIWRQFTGRMPRGELEVVDGGGHLVWYHDPSRVGARVAQFLPTEEIP
jgi:pimeloyl-ACP methyl ester carboxylesterase